MGTWAKAATKHGSDFGATTKEMALYETKFHKLKGRYQLSHLPIWKCNHRSKVMEKRWAMDQEQWGPESPSLQKAESRSKQSLMQSASHGQVKDQRPHSTPAWREITTEHLSPTVFGSFCRASLKPGESLPDTSCCPGNPTGTMPKLFIAVAQAVGSVTDMLSWVVSRAMFPKPSAAAGETNSA